MNETTQQQRPTPITDDAYTQREAESGFHHNVRKRETMQDLERQLAEARETISDMETRHAAMMLHTQTIVDESNGLREQRDRLAEALERMAQTEPASHNGDLFYPRHTPNGDYAGEEQVDPLSLIGQLFGMIREALAAVKGGPQ